MTFRFDAASGRQGRASVYVGVCMKCAAQATPCLCVDNSEDEYASLWICEQCVDGLFRAGAASFPEPLTEED